MKINALVIGCGNIGAMYDFNNSMIQTHVKAFAEREGIELAVYDKNIDLGKRVSNKYNCSLIENYSPEILSSFDLISICTPTDTHLNFFSDAIQSGASVILCEKPLTNKLEEINKFDALYRSSDAKVLVNYIRRFQPHYNKAKRIISTKAKNLKYVKINYTKGFLNFGSHAFDTIEFLTDNEIEPTNIVQNSKIFDHFERDPTIETNFTSSGINIQFSGMSLPYPVFEIKLFYSNVVVTVANLGHEIFFEFKDGDENILLSDCLNNYMVPICDYAIQLHLNNNLKDNFLSSLRLNKKMLKILNN